MDLKKDLCGGLRIMNQDKLVLNYESIEQLQDFVAIHTNPGTRAIMDNEIAEYMHYYMLAVAMTRLKLAGILWFDEEKYPHVPDVPVNVTLKEGITEPREATKNCKQFYGRTLTELSNIARRMEKPEWATNEETT